jgi:hypothetical protein
VNYRHILRVSGTTFRLGSDVIKVDVVLEQLTLSDLSLADTTSVPLLHPQPHAER